MNMKARTFPRISGSPLLQIPQTVLDKNTYIEKVKTAVGYIFSKYMLSYAIFSCKINALMVLVLLSWY